MVRRSNTSLWCSLGIIATSRLCSLYSGDRKVVCQEGEGLCVRRGRGCVSGGGGAVYQEGEGLYHFKLDREGLSD